MPEQPPLDGLPLWAQLAISFVVGLATLAVALKGYLIRDKPAVTGHEPTTAAILGASIADMGAIRNLSDCVVRLDASIVALTRTISDDMHYRREGIELNRETCARLRELREASERLAEIAERHLK